MSGWESEGTAILEDSNASPVTTLQQSQSPTLTLPSVVVSPAHHFLPSTQAHGTSLVAGWEIKMSLLMFFLLEMPRRLRLDVYRKNRYKLKRLNGTLTLSVPRHKS